MEKIKAVYVAKSKALGLVKIGWSSRVETRIENLRYAEVRDIELVAAIPTDYPVLVESTVHSRFKRLRRVSEWFDVDPEQAEEAVREAAQMAKERSIPDKPKGTKDANLSVLVKKMGGAQSAADHVNAGLVALGVVDLEPIKRRCIYGWTSERRSTMARFYIAVGCWNAGIPLDEAMKIWPQLETIKLMFRELKKAPQGTAA